MIYLFNARFFLALAFITMPLWIGLIMGTVVYLGQKYEVLHNRQKTE